MTTLPHLQGDHTVTGCTPISPLESSMLLGRGDRQTQALALQGGCGCSLGYGIATLETGSASVRSSQTGVSGDEVTPFPEVSCLQGDHVSPLK